jgi:FlaA1/EpsC-like NDP-sugar epimerase
MAAQPQPDQTAATPRMRAGLYLERNRTPIQVTVDLLAWAIALFVGMVLRFEFHLSPDRWNRFTVGGLLVAIGLACALQALAGLASGLYTGRWRFGSFDEVEHLVRTVAVTGVLLAVANALLPQLMIPQSVAAAGSVIALVLMAGVRYLWRLLLERSRRPSEDARRVLVFGAGEGGVQVITAMLRNPDSPYRPVGLIDDDPSKSKLSISGVPVVGDRYAIATQAAQTDADAIVIAVPSAGAELLRELFDLGIDAGLRVSALPPINELFGATIGVGDIRPITEADLLGRHEIDTDIDAIAGYLTARRVLVTGAGGSIGSELCRQIARFGPDQLVMVDRDESALHGVQLLLEGRATLDSPNLVVADLRDAERMVEVFNHHRPHVVFHAAALKHLPLLELYPAEALKTNVFGTNNVLAAARATAVERFVNISTDKAADPVSVLGYTKRIAEQLTAEAAGHADGTYLSVRFGNVLGSRGSVLTTFRAQIDAGGPVTVTDPDVTRYFMTVEEAVQLVIQAGAVGNDGEALVLDMGEPVRIADVARRLVAQAERPIDIVYTGLRPGEKRNEVLLAADEVDVRPAHALISHVTVPPLGIADIAETTRDLQGPALREALSKLVLPALGETTHPSSTTQVDQSGSVDPDGNRAATDH